MALNQVGAHDPALTRFRLSNLCVRLFTLRHHGLDFDLGLPAPFTTPPWPTFLAATFFTPPWPVFLASTFFTLPCAAGLAPLFDADASSLRAMLTARRVLRTRLRAGARLDLAGSPSFSLRASPYARSTRADSTLPHNLQPLPHRTHTTLQLPLLLLEPTSPASPDLRLHNEPGLYSLAKIHF